MMTAVQPPTTQQRQSWMTLLATASLSDLEALISQCGELPAYQFVRSPETGLTMVRGRMGGTGQPFNLGEMTLTRCVVQIADETGGAIAGFGYVAGRSHRHAVLAALCDALLQHPTWAAIVQANLLQPLQALAEERHKTQTQEAEATRVNFFTLQRGEA